MTSNKESAATPLTAAVTWAQRRHMVIVNFMVPSATNTSVTLSPTGRQLVLSAERARPNPAQGESPTVRYAMTLNLFGAVHPLNYKPQSLLRFIRVKLTKDKAGDWERLTEESAQNLRHLVSYDWDLDSVWEDDSDSDKEKMQSDEETEAGSSQGGTPQVLIKGSPGGGAAPNRQKLSAEGGKQKEKKKQLTMTQRLLSPKNVVLALIVFMPMAAIFFKTLLLPQSEH